MRNVNRAALIAALVFVTALAASSSGQAPYRTSPNWISSDRQVSTGGALVDLDRDGWLDLVVSNGNDIYRQRVVAYYNRGDGTLSPSPGWQSADLAYNGHLDVADVNGDGYPDVAVSLLLNEGGPAAKLYLNNGGTLSTLPDWISAEIANTFGLAFGDVNNDGRPDLAVATGWPYGDPHVFRNTLHVNRDGELETLASWQSADTLGFDGALWVDGDEDGWLDLILTGTDTDTWLYPNLGGSLDTTARWRTTDNTRQFAIMATAGDVNGDGLRELFVTDNTQLYSGSGRFRQYNGRSPGYFDQTPSWTYFDGYGSAIALADVNADGLLDLATGAWWDRTRLFLNNGTGLPTSPSWNSAGTSVVEKIVFGDVNNDALRRTTERFAAAGPPELFYLRHQPIQDILDVRVDGRSLEPFEYTFDAEHGWVSVGAAVTVAIKIDYAWSRKPDMAVTNWDERGNFLYYNELAVNGDCDGDGDVELDDYRCFHDCMTGPGGGAGGSCSEFDWDIDDDVDLREFADIQNGFTGP